MLKVLRLEVTNSCPLACQHCSVNAGPARRGFVSREQALELISQFALQGGSSLVLTGGEPLDHPEILDFLRLAKHLNLDTTLFSMGIRVDCKPLGLGEARVLAALVSSFRVSVHGSTPAVHDGLTRVAGSLDATLESVRTLVSAGVEVKATFFAHPGNIEDIEGAARLCKKVGIHEMRVLVAVAQGRAARRMKELALEPYA
jgi:MoaA/NifB/PqqE/SkfB family radical SAM enzyme